jgi:hypothetical protein
MRLFGYRGEEATKEMSKAVLHNLCNSRGLKLKLNLNDMFDGT